MGEPVYVIGATGRSGLALSRALLARGTPVIPVVRDPAKWREARLPGDPRHADLTDASAMRRALADATRLVSCAHARHAGQVIAHAPEAARLVFLGSTRRFSRWRDDHGAGVLAGETALLASGRSGVMLHPTMIYGAQGENNVQRLARLLARLPLVPLPAGGRALVQPIHQDDLTRCILAALDVDWGAPRSLVVAGPVAVRYADFVRAVARAAGLPRPRIVSLPGRLLVAVAPLTAIVPMMPTVGAAEMRRLLEDKAFDVAPMVATLGVRPMPLEDGLARTWLKSPRRA